MIIYSITSRKFKRNDHLQNSIRNGFYSKHNPRVKYNLTVHNNPVIPKKIFQTYKTEEFPSDIKEFVQLWKDEKEYEYVFMNDTQMREFIQAENPSVLEFFDNLPVGAMKADIWRYVILEKYGGIYTDIDTRKILPINRWKLENPINKDMLVTCIEHNNLFFAQWTLMASPNHPFFKFLIRKILERYKIEGIKINSDDEFTVHKICGPGIFSDCIRNYLGVSDLTVLEVYDLYEKNTEVYMEVLMDPKTKNGSDKPLPKIVKFRDMCKYMGIYIRSACYFQGTNLKHMCKSIYTTDDYVSWRKELGIVNTL